MWMHLRKSRKWRGIIMLFYNSIIIYPSIASNFSWRIQNYALPALAKYNNNIALNETDKIIMNELNHNKIELLRIESLRINHANGNKSQQL